ncbi:MAG: 50S ribosomal protein L10 [Phycisphaeraceae bacterium]|nr:50S ribosomal protein L10 [Phycisphaeraceae bacterium]
MSKTVKEMLTRDYRTKLEDQENALVISIRGVKSGDTNKMRMDLARKSIKVTVVRNDLARRAFEGSSLAALEPLLNGSSALAYGGESVVEVARELVELVKQIPTIELKGALLDGELFEGEDGVKRLSAFPTRDEAIADVVTLVLSPARKLAGQLKGPGSRVAGVVKAIEEKLEKGEAISKAG